MSGVESFIPGMDGVTGVTEKYVAGVTGPGEQLGVNMTTASNTYLQPTGEIVTSTSKVLVSCSFTFGLL